MGGLTQPQPAQQDESGRIWTFVGLGVAIVVIVVAVLAVIGRSGRTGPRQPPAYASKLQLTDLKLSAAENFVGATVSYLDGKITNAGDKTVTACRIEAVFRNSMGQIVDRQAQPLMILHERQGFGYPDLIPLAQMPLP